MIEIDIKRYVAFPTYVYSTELPELVTDVHQMACQYLPNEVDYDFSVYPIKQTSNFFNDPSCLKFDQYIMGLATNILTQQGYDLQNFQPAFSEMWMQDHHRGSRMEQHVHGRSTHLVGFYFLTVPENSSEVIFHDPRPGKVQLSPWEDNPEQFTDLKNTIVFSAGPGRILMTNSWVPHSFTRHNNDAPLRFVHFNIDLIPAVYTADVEVI
jgi:hypothetical protein